MLEVIVHREKKECPIEHHFLWKGQDVPAPVRRLILTAQEYQDYYTVFWGVNLSGYEGYNRVLSMYKGFQVMYPKPNVNASFNKGEISFPLDKFQQQYGAMDFFDDARFEYVAVDLGIDVTVFFDRRDSALLGLILNHSADAQTKGLSIHAIADAAMTTLPFTPFPFGGEYTSPAGRLPPVPGSV